MAEDGPISLNLKRCPEFSAFVFQGLKYHIYQATGETAEMGWGYCDSTVQNGERIIWISEEAAGLTLVMACVHEALHACLHDMPEEKVGSIADEIADFVGAYMITTSPGSARGAGLDHEAPIGEQLRQFFDKFAFTRTTRSALSSSTEGKAP